MRKVFPLNRGWLFAPRELGYTAPDGDFTAVTLPHTNVILPYHNFDNAEYQFISTYRRHFVVPEPPRGRRVIVEFDGAMTASTVSINGRVLGDHDGGYTPFSFDLTDYLRGDENVLQVRLDSSERPDIPPNGGVVDYLTFGGIYREARLLLLPPVHIADVFARARAVLSDAPGLSVDVRLKNLGASAVEVTAQAALEGAATSATTTLAPGDDRWITLELDGLRAQVPGLRLWSLDDPALYPLQVTIANASETLDAQTVRIGLREAIFRDDGFYLNGERIKLFGLNRHQTYPYIGGAAPARLQRKDADILKHELSLNIVRTSHYPQSPHFLDRCDEIGLLVFEEIPGWQFVGDNDWQALSLDNVRRMIERDRNHPSIVLWGVRINESWDNEPFYKATNALAHQLDPTRQTGGVRNFQHSQFLEDVFTYNDFSNTIEEPKHTPHLVTEFCGHMFPTKSFDAEERQVEHALRHARIHNQQMGMANVTGAIGWCAFDYNTHREFGAGDRICYHGVMDIFRLPKFAAYFYESQCPPSKRVVLRAATFWTFGERSEAGVEPLYVFSNCDSIEVYKGDALHGRFEPDREAFPNLPHPPFRVMGFPLLAMFGHNYEDLRIVGLLNGQPAAEQRLSARGVPHALLLTADDAAIYADGADMTRLVFKIVDEFGNRLPYAIAPVSFDIDGPGILIGENPFPLVGGQAAIYVRATETAGVITVRAAAPRLSPAFVTIVTQ
ncbi:MAG: glycoside hydrolase family 2 TIM barrel-domain containing protein [Aggregatilineales bacterium]